MPGCAPLQNQHIYILLLQKNIISPSQMTLGNNLLGGLFKHHIVFSANLTPQPIEALHNIGLCTFMVLRPVSPFYYVMAPYA